MTARKKPVMDDRALLESLRDTLLEAIASARMAPEDKQGQIAPLAKQLRDTMTALAGLPAAKKSTTDEIAARRKARLAGAAVPTGAAGKVVSGSGGRGTGGKRGSDAGPVAGTRPRRSAGRGA